MLYIDPIVSSQSIRIRNTRQEFDICEGSSMRIICEVKDVRASVFYWFRCNDKCTVYSRLLPVINGEGSATVQDPITGLQITIDQAVLTGNRAISFNSTMIIDSSIYNKDPVQTFKCGRNNNPESNSFAIDYGLQSVYKKINSFLERSMIIIALDPYCTIKYCGIIIMWQSHMHVQTLA